MSGWDSPIIRVSTGKLNTVNDTVIANQAGITGVSKFGGQLGKILGLSEDQISTMFDSNVGILHGGMYQYVQLSPTLGTPEPAIGQMLFWDEDEDPLDYIVTDTATSGVGNPAGVFIGGTEAGNYGFLCTGGLCYLLFGALTVGGAAGQGIVVLSTGLADNSATPTNPTYVGYARTVPVAHSLGLVNLAPIAPRF